MKNKILILLSISLILNLFLVSADFEYSEEFDVYSRQYDTWIYNMDIDDEDVKVVVSHRWSSPKYEYEYETESDFAFHYGDKITWNRYGFSDEFYKPSRESYDIGRKLVDLFDDNRYRRYSGYSYSRGVYYRNYW